VRKEPDGSEKFFPKEKLARQKSNGLVKVVFVRILLHETRELKVYHRPGFREFTWP
jgi:hypothetical protein